jgi:HTH-type transcriptional regulator / antitoxin HigA
MCARDDDTFDYMALVQAFRLTHIRDDAHLAEAVGMINTLLDLPERSAGQEDYLSALTDLVEVYEDQTVPLPAVSGHAVLLHLMEENGLKQADLLPAFGTRSVASAVINGRRNLSLSHIRKLSEFFHVPADVFI